MPFSKHARPLTEAEKLSRIGQEMNKIFNQIIHLPPGEGQKVWKKWAQELDVLGQWLGDLSLDSKVYEDPARLHELRAFEQILYYLMNIGLGYRQLGEKGDFAGWGRSLGQVHQQLVGFIDRLWDRQWEFIDENLGKCQKSSSPLATIVTDQIRLLNEFSNDFDSEYHPQHEIPEHVIQHLKSDLDLSELMHECIEKACSEEERCSTLKQVDAAVGHFQAKYESKLGTRN